MNIADLNIQMIDLKLACSRLDIVVDDIEKLKVKLAELLEDNVDLAGDYLRPGSRFRKLLSVKALIDDVGIDAFAARRSVKEALAFQQACLPTPEDLA